MNSFKFDGKGFAFFKIHIVNVILVVLSLSFLYPWAKIRELKYILQNTYLADNAFSFNGSVKEFFKGYVRTLILILLAIALYAAGVLLSYKYKDTIFAGFILWFLLAIFLCCAYYISPIVLHGSINYRFQNTSWLAISPSYTGKLSELVPLYFRGAVLTTLTAGIYKAWFQVRLVKYILRNSHFGNTEFDFCGEAKPLFLICLKGFALSVVTFGIYGIWFAKQLYEYTVNNIVVKKDDQEFKLESDANTLEIFEMMVGNMLLTCLTLGIGASWAYMRYYRFIVNHCVVPAEFNFSPANEMPETKGTSVGPQNWLDKWNPVLIA